MSVDVRRYPAGYLGVDMGGSATRAHLSDGEASRDWNAPGGNVTLDRVGVRDILIGLLRDADPIAACFGLAGSRTAPDAVAWLAGELAPLGATVTLLTDADLALTAAFGPDGEGIVICAGTGSVAVVRSQGATHLVGGHGYLLGDAGSAYDIGRRIVAAALAERDRGGHALGDEVEAALGETLDAVVARVYRAPTERSHLARLAEKVSSMRSPAARVVLDDAAAALADLARTAQQRFGPLPVRLMGGVSRDPLIAETLRRVCDATPVLRRPEVVASELAAGSVS